MKKIITAILLIGTTCLAQNTNEISTDELAKLSGISIAKIQLPADEILSPMQIRFVRIESDKIETIGWTGGSTNYPKDKDLRVLLSVRHNENGGIITVLINGGTVSCNNLGKVDRPFCWFEKPEKFEGVYVFLSSGGDSHGFREGKGVAYGIKFEKWTPTSE